MSENAPTNRLAQIHELHLNRASLSLSLPQSYFGGKSLPDFIASTAMYVFNEIDQYDHGWAVVSGGARYDDLGYSLEDLIPDALEDGRPGALMVSSGQSCKGNLALMGPCWIPISFGSHSHVNALKKRTAIHKIFVDIPPDMTLRSAKILYGSKNTRKHYDILIAVDFHDSFNRQSSFNAIVRNVQRHPRHEATILADEGDQEVDEDCIISSKDALGWEYAGTLPSRLTVMFKAKRSLLDNEDVDFGPPIIQRLEVITKRSNNSRVWGLVATVLYPFRLFIGVVFTTATLFLFVAFLLISALFTYRHVANSTIWRKMIVLCRDGLPIIASSKLIELSSDFVTEDVAVALSKALGYLLATIWFLFYWLVWYPSYIIFDAIPNWLSVSYIRLEPTIFTAVMFLSEVFICFLQITFLWIPGFVLLGFTLWIVSFTPRTAQYVPLGSGPWNPAFYEMWLRSNDYPCNTTGKSLLVVACLHPCIPSVLVL